MVTTCWRREQSRAGRVLHCVFDVGHQGVVDHQRQGHQALLFPSWRGGNRPTQPTWAPQGPPTCCVPAAQKLGAGGSGNGCSHFQHRRLQPLLLLAGTQAHDAKRQVVGQLLQRGGFLRPDVQHFGGIQIEQTEGMLCRAQRQADDAMKTVAMQTLGNVGKVGSVCTSRTMTGWPERTVVPAGPALGRVVRPGQLQRLQVVGMVTSVGHDFDGLVCIVARKTDPAELIATNVHHDAADGLQQRRLGGGAHQDFVAAAEHVARAMRASSRCARRRSVTLVAITWRAAMPLNVMPRDHFDVHRFAAFVAVTVQNIVAWRLVRHGLHVVVQALLILGQPQVVHAHAQELFLAVAIEFLHGLVDRQKPQGLVFHIHPDGLRMGIKQVSVLLLRRAQPGSHLAQLHHGAQRFRQDLQVRQIALAENAGAPT